MHPNQRTRALCFLIALTTLIGAHGIALAQSSTDSLTLSPTTGLPADGPYRPVTAVISNSREARPCTGIGQADIVYETIMWGPGHTRYFAVFGDEHPERVGSLRGARVFHAELQMAWDAPMVHLGGQATEGTSIYDFFAEHGITKEMEIDGTGTSVKGFSRDQALLSPHNMFFAMEEFVAQRWPGDLDTGEPYAARLPAMTFGDTPSTSDVPMHTIYLDYGPDYRPTYVYAAPAGVYYRAYDGIVQLDATTGLPIQVSNIIIQENVHGYFEGNASRPVLETTGSGPMTAFIGGRMIEGVWSREALEDPIEYHDLAGEAIIFSPGKTFIQVVPGPMYQTADNPATSAIHYTNVDAYRVE